MYLNAWSKQTKQNSKWLGSWEEIERSAVGILLDITWHRWHHPITLPDCGSWARMLPKLGNLNKQTKNSRKQQWQIISVALTRKQYGAIRNQKVMRRPHFFSSNSGQNSRFRYKCLGLLNKIISNLDVSGKQTKKKQIKVTREDILGQLEKQHYQQITVP